MNDTSKPKPTHTPEPWHVAAGYPVGRPVIKRGMATLATLHDTTESIDANAARLVACVNAMAGIADPEATVRLWRDVAEDAELTLLAFAEMPNDSYPSDVRRMLERLREVSKALGGVQ